MSTSPAVLDSKARKKQLALKLKRFLDTVKEGIGSGNKSFGGFH